MVFTNFQKIMPVTSQDTHYLWYYYKLICDSTCEEVTLPCTFSRSPHRSRCFLHPRLHHWIPTVPWGGVVSNRRECVEFRPSWASSLKIIHCLLHLLNKTTLWNVLWNCLYISCMYRGELKVLYVLLSRTVAEPGRTVEQDQECKSLLVNLCTENIKIIYVFCPNKSFLTFNYVW